MATSAQKIEKKHIAAMASYAIRYIPGVDQVTLHKFLELVNITGSLGWVSEKQLVNKLHFVVKYLPGTCSYSLLTVVDLLSIYLPLEPDGPQSLVIMVEAQRRLEDAGFSLADPVANTAGNIQKARRSSTRQAFD